MRNHPSSLLYKCAQAPQSTTTVRCAVCGLRNTRAYTKSPTVTNSVENVRERERETESNKNMRATPSEKIIFVYNLLHLLLLYDEQKANFRKIILSNNPKQSRVV